MNRFLSLFVCAFVLAACGREPEPSVAGSIAVPAHPLAPPPPDAARTAIGDVRAIDAATHSIIVAVVTGSKQEQRGLGRLERLKATATQRAAVQVGEVIEFRYRPARPYPEVLSVARHIHGEPATLPKP